MGRKRMKYTYNRDKQVQFIPELLPKRWVFVDRPPSTSSRNAGNEITTVSYNKLQPQKPGPLPLVKVRPHTVVINKDGVFSAVSIHRIRAAPGPEKNHHAATSGHAWQSNSSQTISDEPRQPKDWASGNVVSKESLQTEYAVEKIVCHKDHCRKQQYIVQWYEYKTENDTLEPARNILRHFITRYIGYTCKQASSQRCTKQFPKQKQAHYMMGCLITKLEETSEFKANAKTVRTLVKTERQKFSERENNHYYMSQGILTNRLSTQSPYYGSVAVINCLSTLTRMRRWSTVLVDAKHAAAKTDDSMSSY